MEEFEVHSLALLLFLSLLPGYLEGREAAACSCCHIWSGISGPQQRLYLLLSTSSWCISYFSSICDLGSGSVVVEEH